MSLFANLATDSTIEEDKDVLGGYKPLESGAYDFTIDLAYVDYSKSGAMSVNFQFKNAEGQSHRETIYVTSGKEKGCKNYYESKDGTKRYIPGFTIVNSICLLSIGEELTSIEPEEKVLSLYNWELKKEAPTKKMVITELLGKDITIGLVQTKEPKYSDPDTIITKVEIKKVFRATDHMTVAEIKGEAKEATFYDEWVEKYTGTVVDNTNSKQESTKAPAQEKKSLFK